MSKAIGNSLLSIVACIGMGATGFVHASDHADHNRIEIAAGKLNDFYMFENDGKLVFILTTGAPIKQVKSKRRIQWNQNITYRFNLDYTTKVNCIDNIDTSQGPPVYRHNSVEACDEREVYEPENIHEDVFFDVTIDENGLATRTVGTYPSAFRFRISYGLADDPFIRTSVNGKNTAAIIVSVDLDRIPIHDGNGYLLGWANSRHNKLDVQIDHAGEPYASQGIAPYHIPTDSRLNRYHPSLHMSLLNKTRPDVLILNPELKSKFPNGRSLEDDVVFELAVKGGPTRAARPDKPFKNTFPYLASPHPIMESPK